MCELLADPCLSLPPFTGRKPLSFHSQAVLPSPPTHTVATAKVTLDTGVFILFFTWKMKLQNRQKNMVK